MIRLGNRIAKVRHFSGVCFALEISNTACYKISIQVKFHTVKISIKICCDAVWHSNIHSKFLQWFFFPGIIKILFYNEKRELTCIAIYVVLNSLSTFSIHNTLQSILVIYMGSLENNISSDWCRTLPFSVTNQNMFKTKELLIKKRCRTEFQCRSNSLTLQFMNFLCTHYFWAVYTIWNKTSFFPIEVK